VPLESKAVEFRSNIAPRIGQDRNEQFSGLALVKARRPERAQRNALSSGATFLPAQMRHNFAIWALEKDAASSRRLQLYYCIRCKWAFSVDHRCWAVTIIPLDQNGKPIQGTDAAERLATFSQGPCPALSRLAVLPRLTQKMTIISTLLGRLAALIFSRCRACRANVRGWRQRVLRPGFRSWSKER
jgi:hypothetical protein